MKAQRVEKRAAERAKRKDKGAALREGYAAGTLTPEEKEAYEKKVAMRQVRRKDTGSSKADWKGGVVIDLGFDELMHDGVGRFLWRASRTEDDC